MCFKIIAYYPKEYIADGWNKFDFIVVNLSVAAPEQISVNDLARNGPILCRPYRH